MADMVDAAGIWAQAEALAFGPGEGLAPALRGRRLLADLDGPARLEVLAAPEDVETGPRVVEDFLEVESGAAGGFLAVIRRGAAGPPPAGRVGRAGWALVGGTAFELDGSRERIIWPGPPIWMPFYDSAEGAKEVRSEPWRLQTVLALRPDDAEGLAAADWWARNSSRPEPLDSQFADGTPRIAMRAAHLNEAAFTAVLPHGAEGLRLRKIYDRFHGRQRARVLVDGAAAGWWHLPRQRRDRRWAAADFFIPRGLIAGRKEVRIQIDPPASVPLWDWSELQAAAIMPA
jgi:hypothetical protein